jgi:hypothetical protein
VSTQASPRQQDQRGDQLQIVLHPVVDLVQQGVFLREGLFQRSSAGVGRVAVRARVSRVFHSIAWLCAAPELASTNGDGQGRVPDTADMRPLVTGLSQD